MFIKKDLRKIPTILEEASDNDNETIELKDLRLQRRQAEFNGNVKILCQPANAPTLSNLQSLSLYDCGIENLEGIGMLTLLQTLNAGRNPLTTLPDDLKELSNLKELWLDDCSLSGMLPSPILELTALEELRLSNNQIEEIPSTISKLEHLRILGLDNNRIQQLPDNLQHLPLTKLLIGNNGLQQLPDSLPSTLKLLTASSNRLTNLPDGLVDCVDLTHLYLNGNQLTGTTVSLDLLIHLQRLNLAHNRIDYLPTDFFLTFGQPDEQGLCSFKPDCIVWLLGNPVMTKKDTTAETMDVEMAEAIAA